MGGKPQNHEVQNYMVRNLQFRQLGFANIRQKAGMSRAAAGIALARLVQAQISIHCQAYFGGIRVFLAVVLPPADRAQSQRSRRFQRLVPATRTTKTTPQGFPSA